MQVLRIALGALGFKTETGPARPNYRELMENALKRVRMAELQIQEATSLEELDLGRAAMQSGWAEVQQLVRTAKRERGIAVLPISETEEKHHRMRDFMNHRDPSPTGDDHLRTGTH